MVNNMNKKIIKIGRFELNNKSIYINRFELISDSGREKTIYCKDMYFQIQDGGRTLKVFYQDKNVCKNGKEILNLLGEDSWNWIDLLKELGEEDND